MRGARPPSVPLCPVPGLPTRDCTACCGLPLRGHLARVDPVPPVLHLQPRCSRAREATSLICVVLRPRPRPGSTPHRPTCPSTCIDRVLFPAHRQPGIARALRRGIHLTVCCTAAASGSRLSSTTHPSRLSHLHLPWVVPRSPATRHCTCTQQRHTASRIVLPLRTASCPAVHYFCPACHPTAPQCTCTQGEVLHRVIVLPLHPAPGSAVQHTRPTRTACPTCTCLGLFPAHRQPGIARARSRDTPHPVLYCRRARRPARQYTTSPYLSIRLH